mmetsp:Transcript_4623/g.3605  ORF Transcript_4623/g.3605 Transcript_4623/m.3605 type:complete len:83 (-) Transcript_4623:133-381(-)
MDTPGQDPKDADAWGAVEVLPQMARVMWAMYPRGPMRSVIEEFAEKNKAAVGEVKAQKHAEWMKWWEAEQKRQAEEGTASGH